MKMLVTSFSVLALLLCVGFMLNAIMALFTPISLQGLLGYVLLGLLAWMINRFFVWVYGMLYKNRIP